MNRNNKLVMFAIFVVTATAFVSSVATFGDNMAFADKKEKSNHSDQVIDEQGQYVSQGAQCVSGEAIIFACNNLGVQLQENEGNNAAAQQ